MLGEQCIEQLSLHRLRLVCGDAFREMWNRDPNTRSGRAHVHADRPVCCDRFLDEEDAMLPGATAEKVLRPLKDEIPAQMREDNDIEGRAAMRYFGEQPIHVAESIHGRYHVPHPPLYRWN